MATCTPTSLVYHHDAALHRLQTKVVDSKPFQTLPEASRTVFKQAEDNDTVVVTEKTIFHAQGGGQPTDTGVMELKSQSSTFNVAAVRLDAVVEGQVLHLGRYTTGDNFKPGDVVEQNLDSEKRDLYSRYHTGGHVLGAAVRNLLESQVEGFDELKASHFPDSASCEFRGLIDGKHKEAIQAKVDEYVAKAMPVEIEWWSKEDFEESGRPLPDESILPPYRVVRIVGAEVYPCGGTHVANTSLCGKINVRKISRSKGISRVSYSMA